MGFKSGLFPGQSIVLIFFFFKNSLTILDLWHGAMCNCSFSCNICRYLAPFMVVPFGRKKSPAVPFDDIAPHIITLGGCFIVATVYRTSKRVPTALRTFCLRVPNCWIVDSSEKRTFTHCFSLQSADLFANITLLAFIASVSLGFSTGLWDLRPNSFTKRLPIVVQWTSVPFKSSADRIFLQELVGERTATLWIKWSSRGVVFRGRPLLFVSTYEPQILNFTIAWCTAVLLHSTFSLIKHSDCPSLCKITIWARFTSLREAFLYQFLGLKNQSKKWEIHHNFWPEMNWLLLFH